MSGSRTFAAHFRTPYPFGRSEPAGADGGTSQRLECDVVPDGIVTPLEGVGS